MASFLPALLLAYAFSMAFIPSFTSILSASIAGLIVLFFFMSTVFRPHFLLSRSFLLVYMFLSGFFLLLDGSQVIWDAHFRYVVSLISLTFLLGVPIPDRRQLFSCLGGATICLAVLVASTSGLVTYAGTLRLAPFFGDVDSIHSSALIVLAASSIIWFGPWRRTFRVFWLAIAAFLLFGYGTASEMVMLAILVAALVFQSLKLSRLLLLPFGVAVIGLALMYRNANSLEGATVDALGVDAIGSGRLGTWMDRAVVFADYNLLHQFFGTGAYTDFRFSGIWSWEPKSAHNDWITMLMEYGIFGVTLLGCYFIFTWLQLRGQARVVLFVIFVGMLLTNSVLDRPSVTIYWGIVLYCAQRHAFVQRST